MFYLTSLSEERLSSLPSQRLVINTLDDADSGGKIDLCGGRKTGEPGENSRSQIEINQSQPT